MASWVYLLARLALLVPVVQALCYWPDGSDADSYFPCQDPSNKTLACCALGEPCLSSGLCFSPPIGIIYRGACSEQSWSSSGCPKIFIGKGMDGGTANLYNCYGTETFHNGSGGCTQPDVYVYTSASILAFAGEPTLAAAAASTSSPSPAPDANTTQCPTAVASQCPTPGTSSTAVGVGAGLGVGLPLLVLAAALAILWRRERKARVRAEASHTMPSQQGIAMNRFNEIDTHKTLPGEPGELNGIDAQKNYPRELDGGDPTWRRK